MKAKSFEGLERKIRKSYEKIISELGLINLCKTNELRENNDILWNKSHMDAYWKKFSTMIF